MAIFSARVFRLKLGQRGAKLLVPNRSFPFPGRSPQAPLSLHRGQNVGAPDRICGPWDAGSLTILDV